MEKNKDQKKINLKFEGKNIGEGIIGVYDLANTILAFSQIIDVISTKEQVNKKGRVNINVSALRAGSFDVQMVISVDDIAKATLGVVPLLGVLTSHNLSEYIISIFTEILRIKKFLKGKKPKSITVNQNGDNNIVVIMNAEGESTSTQIPVIGTIQDKRTSDALKKLIEPIAKEDSNVEQIKFTEEGKEEGEGITISDTPYFESEEDYQTIPNYSLKGVATAFDRKTGTGRLSISESKRVIYDLSYEQELKIIEKNSLLLIESMKLKIPVILKGEAIFDYESNIKKIIVSQVDPESKLFDEIKI